MMIPADGNRSFRVMFWFFGGILTTAGILMFSLSVDGYRPAGADALAGIVTVFGAMFAICGFFASSIVKWLSK